MNNNAPVITVDGHSGSGKGTISQLLAKKLNWHFLDSGAIYRLLALIALKKNISSNDQNSLVELAKKLNIQFKNNNGPEQILLDGCDVTLAIRSEKCSEMSSLIAILPAVRDTLLTLQRSFRKTPGLVADGRDMGTVVFPDAALKIFLTATPEKRAERRYKQFLEQKIDVNLQEILKEIIKRDTRDEKRNIAPLKPATDSTIIDTSNITIEEVLNKIIKKIEEKGIIKYEC